MKKLLLLGLLSCSPLSAFQGMYVGGSLGGHLGEVKQRGEALTTVTPPAGITSSFPLSLQQDNFDLGIQGMLYAGYGFRWRSLYLAAEGFLQFNSIDYNDFQNASLNGSLYGFNYASSVTGTIRTGQFGIDLIPGWELTPQTLIYGRVGVSYSRASLNLSPTSSGFVPTLATWNLSQDLSKNKTFAALRLGAGLEQQLSNRLTMRADYIFTDYGKLSVGGFSTGTPIIVTNIVNFNTDLTSHFYDNAVMLGLSYRFCPLADITFDPCCAALAYCGGYFGGSIGGSALLGTQHNGLINGVTPFGGNAVNITSAAPSQLYNNQFQGMLFLGYGRTWQRLYLAGEIIGTGVSNTTLDFTGETLADNLNEIISSSEFVSSSTSLESSAWQFGFDLRPGALLTPFTLLYARVGVAAAHINAHSTGAFTFITDQIGSDVWSLSDEISSTVWKPALRLGVGLEQQLASNLHLRADYIFTNYGRISLNNAVAGTTSNNNPVTLQNRFSSHLQNNAVVLGLSYFFH